jgi:3'-phosphoadenosine 5'-phosphosulfate (PAPS) 3'-phosphatase
MMPKLASVEKDRKKLDESYAAARGGCTHETTSLGQARKAHKTRCIKQDAHMKLSLLVKDDGDVHIRMNAAFPLHGVEAYLLQSRD